MISFHSFNLSIHHANTVMHPVHASVQARPHRRSSHKSSPRHVSSGHVSFLDHEPQVPLTLAFASLSYGDCPTQVNRLKPSTSWCGWVGKNRISLHILSPVALTAALDIVAVCTTQQAVMTMTQALNRRTPRIIPLTNNLVLRLMSQLTVYLFWFQSGYASTSQSYQYW